LIGTIAPDISKHVGDNKIKSHFLDNADDNIPNLYKFLNSYRSNLNDDFVLGYCIHLYVDYLWFKYFIPEIYNNNYITKLDGTTVECRGQMATQYIYNDYTNLNVKLIDEYDLDLKIFYMPLPNFKDIIKEISMNKLKIIIDKVGKIIEDTKTYKEFVFNLDSVKRFITLSIDIILANLVDLKIINEGELNVR